MPELSAELAFVLDLVETCGTKAREYFAAGPEFLRMRNKPLGGGPVTRADTELNDAIVEALRERFPGDAIVAEESDDYEGGSWGEAERCWHVDPIDGTREFARGNEGWTIQIGLCIEGRPALGVVHEPASYRMSWAIDGDEPIAMHRVGSGRPHNLTLSSAQMEALRLIGGRIYPLSRQHSIRRALGITAERAQSVGSVGVRMTAIARGDADVYVQAPGHTKTWDTCAPAVLIRAAGGTVTDLQGEPLSYHGPKVTHPTGVVASHGVLHDQILGRLEPLVTRWLPAQG